jgi:hypothetical protein
MAYGCMCACLRLRLPEEEAESTRRRQGLLVGGEQLQQLELLQLREAPTVQSPGPFSRACV